MFKKLSLIISFTAILFFSITALANTTAKYQTVELPCEPNLEPVAMGFVNYESGQYYLENGYNIKSVKLYNLTDGVYVEFNQPLPLYPHPVVFITPVSSVTEFYRASDLYSARDSVRVSFRNSSNTVTGSSFSIAVYEPLESSSCQKMLAKTKMSQNQGK